MIYFVILKLLAIILILTTIFSDISMKDSMDLFLTPIVIIASLVIAILRLNQYYKLADMKQKHSNKHLAFIEVNQHIKVLEQYRTKLDKLVIKYKLIKNSNDEPISFSDRLLQGDTIKVKEVHTWICETKKTDNQLCRMSLKGANMIRLILSIINTYEIISLGVRKKILDYDVTIELIGSNIVGNFKIYYSPKKKA